MINQLHATIPFWLTRSLVLFESIRLSAALMFLLATDTLYKREGLWARKWVNPSDSFPTVISDAQKNVLSFIFINRKTSAESTQGLGHYYKSHEFSSRALWDHQHLPWIWLSGCFSGSSHPEGKPGRLEQKLPVPAGSPRGTSWSLWEINNVKSCSQTPHEWHRHTDLRFGYTRKETESEKYSRRPQKSFGKSFKAQCLKWLLPRGSSALGLMGGRGDFHSK